MNRQQVIYCLLFENSDTQKIKTPRGFFMKYSMQKMLAASLFATVTLSGCASLTANQDVVFTQDDRSPLEIISQESQKAVAATKTLTKYARTEAQLVNIAKADFENDRIVLDYIGKPQGLLSSISIKYGYRYLEFNKPIDLPTINFTKVYATPVDLLILIDSQIGDSASVALDKQNKLITLTYK